MPTPEIIARNTLWWSNEVDRLEAAVASLRNDIKTYNEVLAGLKSGELTWDNVQVLETGQLRVIPPAPETCVKEVSKDFRKRNGKKAETAVVELVEVAGGS
jgi:predicted ribosome quality control (RQC) complex YloA/Tae2 family protein